MRNLLGLSLLSLASVASVASAQNLVQNGDFSLGNAGFTTSYDYATPSTDALVPANSYTIAANPATPYLLNSYGVVNYNDHTTGKGLFMLVNGSSTFNSLVWQQTVTGLSIGQIYRFGTWVSRWTPNNESNGATSAKLQANINGLILATFTDPNTSGTWTEQSSLFTATSTSMTLQIRDLETAGYGNDFALDDISVQAVPEPSTWAALGLGLFGLQRRRRSTKS